MEFGWLNIFGAFIVVLMLVPNIIYAIGNKGEVNHCTNKLMNLVEQIGRYACIVLMWFPLMVYMFGFTSKIAMISYFLGNGLLLLIYWIVFFIFIKGKSRGKALLRKLAQIAVERECGRLEWWCLDWNKPSIDFYLSLGAKTMDEWTVYHVTGETLKKLAE